MDDYSRANATAMKVAPWYKKKLRTIFYILESVSLITSLVMSPALNPSAVILIVNTNESEESKLRIKKD